MWSRHYEECIKCGKNDTRHTAKGVCQRCYNKNIRSIHSKKIKQLQKIWYLKNKESILLKRKIQREELNFGNRIRRTAVLRRDKFKCQNCGTSKSLIVHHKDGKGRGSKKKNNKKENLITLCRKCHLQVHRKHIIKNNPRYAKFNKDNDIV